MLPGEAAPLPEIGAATYTYTQEQLRRFAGVFGPNDAERRMRSKDFMYLAARRRFVLTCVNVPRRIFRFGRSVDLIDIGGSSPSSATAPIGEFYPHIDQPWLLFKTDGKVVDVYQGPTAMASARWTTAHDMNGEPDDTWVQVGDYPLRVCRVPDGTVYGQWT